MGNLRHIYRYMKNGQRVLLSDGRTGRIVRVDTRFPARATTLSVWVGRERPSLAKVGADAVVGAVADSG